MATIRLGLVFIITKTVPLVCCWYKYIMFLCSGQDRGCDYRNDPKFSDRQVCANSVHPDQTD